MFEEAVVEMRGKEDQPLLPLPGGPQEVLQKGRMAGVDLESGLAVAGTVWA